MFQLGLVRFRAKTLFRSRSQDRRNTLFLRSNSGIRFQEKLPRLQGFA